MENVKNEFEVTSGEIVCSDPCYDLDTWCQGIVKARNGKWIAEVEISDEGSWGKRIAELKIYHSDIADKFLSEMGKIDLLNFSAGVDSGQFGFFDRGTYRNDDSVSDLVKYDFGANYVKDESGDEWYRACCYITLEHEQFGVLPNGAVSSSGFGDGSYDVFGAKDENGEYIYLHVVFIGEEEEDEDDDDFWGDEEE
jgi:hypothetical protein